MVISLHSIPLLLSIFTVIYISFFFDSQSNLNGLHEFNKTKKSAKSINKYERYKFLSRLPQALYVPFFAIYIISYELDPIIAISYFIFSIFTVNFIMLIREIHFLRNNSITFNQITKNFSFKHKFIFTFAGILDIFIILAPISLNIIAAYFFPTYSQAIVQFLGIFQGFYTFFIVFFMKESVGSLMDASSYSETTSAQITLCKMLVRIFIMAFCLTLFLLF